MIAQLAHLAHLSPRRPAAQRVDHPPAARRLARPLEQMADHYDVVVVGSGYGGAIAAARLARAGRRVCVLERGREFQPGEFPDTLAGAAREFQVRWGTRRFGRAGGLFDLVADSEVSVLVGSGLGGTSLINAGVALRAPEATFDEHWPSALRGNGRAVLDPYYERAEAMLGSVRLPAEPRLPKFAALERAAAAVRGTAEPAPINVSLVEGPNRFGVPMAACNLCGDCVSGCNHGAKNTLLQTYLPDAVAHGAEVFTEATVRTVRRGERPAGGDPAGHDDGAAAAWTVAFVSGADGRGRFGAPELFVTADVVVLAAGTLGTTEILFRSRAHGLALSSSLGERFSGNGDALAWAYDADEPVGGVGHGRRPVTADSAVGPAITGMIDLTDRPGPDGGVLVQDGVIPGPLARVMPAALAMAGGSGGANGEGGIPLRRRLARSARALAASARGRRDPATDATLTYLVMSDDAGEGRLRPEGDSVVVDWAGAGDMPVFDANDSVLRTATAGLGATHVRNPLWARRLREPLITVHPLGGCAMGDDGGRGVVDHRGRAFAGDGRDVHDGLLVLDGSIVPRPLAANPLLTISALAERACDLLVAERGWDAGGALSPEAPPAFPAPDTVGLRFTERMAGWVGRSTDGDTTAGEARARNEGTPMEMVVTVGIDDLPTLLADPAHPGRLTGSVTAPALSPRRLRVVDGEFRLVERDLSRVETWTMRYTMRLLADDGRRFTMAGVKYLHDRAGFDAWSDTTTLAVEVTDEGGAIVAAGVLRLGVGDFARQLTTMRVTGAGSTASALRWKARFAARFLWSLRRIYAGALDDVGRFPEGPARPLSLTGDVRRLDVPTPEPRWCDGAGRWHAGATARPDGWLRLTRYEGGRRGPVLLAPGFGMPATSFLTDTVGENLVEHLTGRGYDVWLFDYRASTDLESSKRAFDMDDVARTDWPTAVNEVLRVTGATSVQVVAHCAGALTLMMALGAGLTGVRSAVCMQFTLHPVVSTFNLLKIRLGVGPKLGMLGVRAVQPLVGRSALNTVLDLGLRALPLPTGQRCGKAVCRWVNGIYGCTHHHEQLDQATHDKLDDYFGVGHLAPLNHLSEIARRGVAVDRHGVEAYTQHPERFRLPILLVSGDKNIIFRPEGTLRTFRWLRAANDPGYYERIVLPGYAHLDALVGKSAATDVFPHLSEHIDRFNP